MIQLNDITFGYKRRGNPVFSHFSMNLEPDSIYGFLGKNGAGKSTLLYLMCGLLRPQSGEALFNGKSVVERRPEILEDIFIVPEEFELPPLKLSTYVKINAPFYPHFSEELLSQCLQVSNFLKTSIWADSRWGRRKRRSLPLPLPPTRVCC